jgi:protein O-GlcNAc transferase
VYYDQGDMQGAIKTYKTAVVLQPKFPDAFNDLGNALKDAGYLEEAILT